MKIAEDYFQRLLDGGDDEYSALQALDAFWCARAGRSESDQWFGLSRAEFDVHLVLHYLGEVGNGGHQQYFLNPVGRYVAETLDALRRTGLSDVHALLLQARTVFHGVSTPRDATQLSAAMEQLDDDGLSLLSRMDERALSLQNRCWPQLLRYLREHQAEVLAEERA
jgi:hypothetical protein